MWAILLGIGMFMFLVVIHELGHFFAAKKTGVKVLEFGVGIPPKAFRVWTDKQGTEYTINRLPLWGFVRLKGESPEDTKEFLAKDSFITAKLWKKMVILFAGVTVNALFAWLAFSLSFMQGVYPISVIPDSAISQPSYSHLMPSRGVLEEQGLISGEVSEIPATVAGLLPRGLAREAGLKEGDIITHIDGKPITNMTLGETLQSHIGSQIVLSITRDGEQLEETVTCPDDECLLGVQIESGGNQEILLFKATGIAAFAAGRHELLEQTALTRRALGNLWRNLVSFNRKKINGSVKKLAGPVGVVKLGEDIYKNGGGRLFLAFAGMISLALAIFNVLPIPALDGGRALSVLIQYVGKWKPEKYFVIENYFNIAFFVILMLLWVYIILLDLVRFWWISIPFIG